MWQEVVSIVLHESWTSPVHHPNLQTFPRHPVRTWHTSSRLGTERKHWIDTVTCRIIQRGVNPCEYLGRRGLIRSPRPRVTFRSSWGQTCECADHVTSPHSPPANLPLVQHLLHYNHLLSRNRRSRAGTLGWRERSDTLPTRLTSRCRAASSALPRINLCLRIQHHLCLSRVTWKMHFHGSKLGLRGETGNDVLGLWGFFFFY